MKMDNVFNEFYKETYNKTNGYVPVLPNNGNVFPGDFFQIRDGQMVVLGNVFRQSIIDALDVFFENNIHLRSSNWSFQQGVSVPYSGRETGQNVVEGEFQYSKHVLSFEEQGSFKFKGLNPIAFRIRNWSDIQNELIIKMTQMNYSFRELYLVTDCVLLDSWTLAIADKKGAELEIASEEESFQFDNIFGESSSKTVQAKDIAFHHKTDKVGTKFFKAKKLMVLDDKTELFISDLMRKKEGRQAWARDFYEQPLGLGDTDLFDANTQYARPNTLDLLQGNQLNPTTALDYFKWGDFDMDDLNKLFL